MMDPTMLIDPTGGSDNEWDEMVRMTAQPDEPTGLGDEWPMVPPGQGLGMGTMGQVNDLGNDMIDVSDHPLMIEGPSEEMALMIPPTDHQLALGSTGQVMTLREHKPRDDCFWPI